MDIVINAHIWINLRWCLPIYIYISIYSYIFLSVLRKTDAYILIPLADFVINLKMIKIAMFL